MRSGTQLAAAGIPFVAAGVAISASAEASVAEALAATAVGVCVAVAIFAINFSFVAFQLAPYRALLAGPSPRHLGASAALILCSTAPLAWAGCGAEWVGRVAMGGIPILGYAALLLIALGLREASPERVLATRASQRALERFVPRFAEAARNQTRLHRELEVDPPGQRDRSTTVPPPMHEAMHDPPPPPLRDDPLEVSVAAAVAAIERDDAAVFVPAVDRLLDLAERLATGQYETIDDVEGREVKSAAQIHAVAAVARVAREVTGHGRREVMTDRFIETIARYLRDAGRRGHGSDVHPLQVYWVAIGACNEQVKAVTQGTGIIGLLTAARQNVERALRTDADFHVDNGAATYAAGVQAIGETAVDERDSDALYRCLETLGWIGSSAVRYGALLTGRRAAGGLVQLGRLARANELECHWSRCAITPYEHAVERLGWLATWIQKAPTPTAWLEPLSTAFSRLLGHRCEFEFEEDGDPPVTLRETPDKPHKEGFVAEGGTRTLDYSDVNELKDQALW